MGNLMSTGWIACVQGRAGLLSVLASWYMLETSLSCVMFGNSMAGLHIGVVARFGGWHWHGPSPPFGVHLLRLWMGMCLGYQVCLNGLWWTGTCAQEMHL